MSITNERMKLQYVDTTPSNCMLKYGNNNKYRVTTIIQKISNMHSELMRELCSHAGGDIMSDNANTNVQVLQESC